MLCFKAKEHIQEMKKELDSLLQTAEKAFAVELLKMPAAVRKMKRKEVLGESAWPCARGAGSGVPGAAGEHLGICCLSWKGLLCLPCILSRSAVLLPSRCSLSTPVQVDSSVYKQGIELVGD